VPVILATLPVIEQVPRSIEMLNIVFFAVLLSAALQGVAVQALATRMWPRRRSSEQLEEAGPDRTSGAPGGPDFSRTAGPAEAGAGRSNAPSRWC
jgi:hypothetical protein